MSSVVISGNTSGSITLSAPDVSGSNTLSLPAVTDTLAGIAATQTLTNKTLTSPTITGATITVASTAAPAFSAYRNSSQSISAATSTKIQFNTEEFDTNSNYDNATNYRFTPTVAGYYQVNGQATTSGYLNRVTIYLYKNGASVRGGLSNTGNGTNNESVNICALIYLNGSTDYIELYVDGTNSFTVIGDTSTYFQAAMIRSA